MYETKTVTITRKIHRLHFEKDGGLFGRDLHEAVEKIPRSAKMEPIVDDECHEGCVMITFTENDEIVEIPVHEKPKKDASELLKEIRSVDDRASSFLFEVETLMPFASREDREKNWYKKLKPQMCNIVGFAARHEELSTCEHYDALYRRCMNILDI